MPINQHTPSAPRRLENLIRARLKENADKEKIDSRIWDSFGEDWCVMFTDLSGFSRGTEKFGIIHFLQIIYESERLMLPVIEDYDGFLIKSEGDSLLVLFKNCSKALLFCKEIFKILKEYNKSKDEEEQILLCIGLGYGKILNIGWTDVFGSEVNAASKLGEDTAKPWEILCTENFKKQLSNIEDTMFEKIDFVPPGATAAYRLVQ